MCIPYLYCRNLFPGFLVVRSSAFVFLIKIQRERNEKRSVIFLLFFSFLLRMSIYGLIILCLFLSFHFPVLLITMTPFIVIIRFYKYINKLIDKMKKS